VIAIRQSHPTKPFYKYAKPMRLVFASIYVFLDQSMPLASRNMDVSAKFGYVQGCMVRTGALKSDLFSKIKNGLERHSFAYFSVAVDRKVMSSTRRKHSNVRLIIDRMSLMNS